MAGPIPPLTFSFRVAAKSSPGRMVITGKNFRKIQGCRDLWMLKAVFEENPPAVQHRVEKVA
jgi:hypothetical protein